MPTFVMLTRLSSDALTSAKSLEKLESQVVEKIQFECPNVEWLHNLAILGDCDYLDIFTAPDIDTAMRVSTIVRTFGHANTEVWTAMEWSKYKELVRHLSAPDIAAIG